MSEIIIELRKERERWNQRWHTDRSFQRGFDYEKAEYADCSYDLRWALPLIERQKAVEFKQWIGFREAVARQQVRGKA